MFWNKGPQPKFGEQSALTVQVEMRSTRQGRGISFSVARAKPGETVDVRVIGSNGSVLAQGAIEADANGDVEYTMAWAYPAGSYRLVVNGRRSGK